MRDHVTWLSGKTALVTGGARRIGRACALALARSGADVVVHYRRSRVEAEAAAEEVRSFERKAWTLRADLADPVEAEGLVGLAIEDAGPLDIVINSASIFPATTIHDMTERDLSENMRVNAWAPFAIGRAFARQDRDGSILNLLDTRILHYDAAHTAYHLSKRSSFTLTRMMALEFAPRVRVNAIAPGLVLPPPGEDEAYLKRLAPTNPLGRHGGAEDVTDALLFLLRSDFITGQVIFVDGGFHMKGSVYG